MAQLEELRESADVSRKRIAGRLGKTRQAIDATMSGRSGMSVRDAEAIAEMLDARLEVVAKGNVANLVRRAIDADDELSAEWRETLWATYEAAKRSVLRRSRSRPDRMRAASSSR